MPSASIAQCTGYRLSREPEQISLTDEQARIAQVIDSEFHRQSQPNFALRLFNLRTPSHRWVHYIEAALAEPRPRLSRCLRTRG
jgi:hypothetical protein